MEGVLVSAKKAGATITYHGRQRRAGPLSLPAQQSSMPGQYAIASAPSATIWTAA